MRKSRLLVSAAMVAFALLSYTATGR